MSIKEKINLIKYPVKYFFFSYLFVTAMDFYFYGENVFGTETIINFCLLIFAYVIQKKAENTEYLTRKYAFAFSLLFSISLTIGKVLYDTNDMKELFISPKRTVMTFVIIVGLTAVLTAVFSYVFTLIQSKGEKGSDERVIWTVYKIPHITLILWGIIFLSWIPCFLAYFPGITAYDIPFQTPEAIGAISDYTKHHPPLHTFIWAICLKVQTFANIEAISIYEIVQMIIMSGVLAKILSFLIKRKISNWLILTTFLFVTLNPVVAIFSIKATKDVYFAIFFALVMIEMIKMIGNPEEYCKSSKNGIIFTLDLLFACLFRNNAIYVYVLSALCVLVILRKYWKKLFLLFAVPIVLFFLINSVLYTGLGIENGSSGEMLSIPIQQIANVVVQNKDTISLDMREKIEDYLPYDEIDGSYNPRFADPVKGKFHSDVYDANKLQFFELWFDLALQYPDEYITAFMTLNLPYWYQDASSVAAFAYRAYIETSIWDNEMYTYELDSKMPILYNFYEQAASYDLFKHIPLVSNLFSVSFPIWLLLFTFCVLKIKKRSRETIVLLPMFFLWLTYMAGPVSNFRYIFPIFLLYPILLILMMDTNALVGIYGARMEVLHEKKM